MYIKLLALHFLSTAKADAFIQAIVKLLPTAKRLRSLRVAIQLFVVVFFTTAMATGTVGKLWHKSAWTVVTSIVCLEPTLGATVRKALMRIIGTLLGGCAACLVILITAGANGGWDYTSTKSFVTSLFLAFCCFVAQSLRISDQNKSNDYAYVVAMFTAAICVIDAYWKGGVGSSFPGRVVIDRVGAIVIGVFAAAVVAEVVQPVIAGAPPACPQPSH